MLCFFLFGFCPSYYSIAEVVNLRGSKEISFACLVLRKSFVDIIVLML